MFMIIPTYSVVWKTEFQKTVWRVPKNELETFIHILLFNDIKDFEVSLEKSQFCSE